jgi:hypothetical protein
VGGWGEKTRKGPVVRRHRWPGLRPCRLGGEARRDALLLNHK